MQPFNHLAKISAMAKPFAATLCLGLVIGAGVAIAAHLFVAGIRWCEDWRNSAAASGGFAAGNALFLPGLCLLLALGAVLFIRKFAAIDRWQGPADAIDQAHRQTAGMSLKQGLASIAAAFFSLAGGASLGQYGPIVHIGGLLGQMFRRPFIWANLSVDIYVGCGVAAAISAGFSAPIAGIIFAHEAVLRHFSERAIVPIAVASVTASSLGSYLFGDERLLSLTAVAPPLLGFVPVLLLSGLVFGLLAVGLMAAHFFTLRQLSGLSLSPVVLGLAGVLLLAGLGFMVPEVLGLGMDTIMQMTAGQFVLSSLVVLLAAKFAAIIISSTTGFVGGFFSPALFLGAAAGGIINQLLSAVSLASAGPLLVVSGMAAVSACVVGAPLAVIVLVLELTMSYPLAVGAMLSVVVASLTAHLLYGQSLFDKQLEARGVDLSEGRAALALSGQTVGSLAQPGYVRLSASDTVSQATDKLTQAGCAEAYCLTDDGILTGKTSLHRLVAGAPDSRVADCLETAPLCLSAQTNLTEAIRQASEFVGESIPVVDQDTGRLCGVITEADLFSVYLQVQKQVKTIEHG